MCQPQGPLRRCLSSQVVVVGNDHDLRFSAEVSYAGEPNLQCSMGTHATNPDKEGYSARGADWKRARMQVQGRDHNPDLSEPPARSTARHLDRGINTSRRI